MTTTSSNETLKAKSALPSTASRIWGQRHAEEGPRRIAAEAAGRLLEAEVEALERAADEHDHEREGEHAVGEDEAADGSDQPAWEKTK